MIPPIRSWNERARQHRRKYNLTIVKQLEWMGLCPHPIYVHLMAGVYRTWMCRSLRTCIQNEELNKHFLDLRSHVMLYLENDETLAWKKHGPRKVCIPLIEYIADAMYEMTSNTFTMEHWEVTENDGMHTIHLFMEKGYYENWNMDRFVEELRNSSHPQRLGDFFVKKHMSTDPLQNETYRYSQEGI